MQASHAPPEIEGNEAALVERARTDGDAFAALYDRYVERVYRYAYRRLGSHMEAEDVTAQTFHRALEGMSGYAWRGAPFGAWLFRIAHNAIVDRYRVAGRTVTLDGMQQAGAIIPAAVPSPDAALLAAEEAAGAWAAVRALPAMQRRAVTLRFARGLSHAEIGAMIGRSEAATKQMMYRAMLTLRARLGVTG